MRKSAGMSALRRPEPASFRCSNMTNGIHHPVGADTLHRPGMSSRILPTIAARSGDHYMNRPAEHTIEQFASACHDILKKENNPAGRSKVCALLQEYLKDAQFVSTYLPDGTPERKVLYEDPELGFCVLAHHYQG